MQTTPETAPAPAGSPTFEADLATPSADFIQAISQFLDTDPSDLLVELGYYSRDMAAASRE